MAVRQQDWVARREKGWRPGTWRGLDPGGVRPMHAGGQAGGTALVGREPPCRRASCASCAGPAVPKARRRARGEMKSTLGQAAGSIGLGSIAPCTHVP